MAQIYDLQAYRSSILLDRAADQSATLGDCFENLCKSYDAMENCFEGMTSALEDSGVIYTELSDNLDERSHLYKRCNAAMKDGTSDEMSSLVEELQVLTARR